MQKSKMFSLLICLMVLSTQALGQHFDYTITDVNHILLVEEATLDGDGLAEGVEIGVFTQDDLCAGAGVLDQDGRAGFAAWGDDEGTDEVDGFRDDEAFLFKVWDADADREYDTVANFLEGPEVYEESGFSLLELEAASNDPAEVVDGIDDLEVNEDSGQGEIADLDDVFSDPDDDELSFEIIEGIDELNLLINDETHIITLEPTENYFGESNVVIGADDGHENSENAFRITVIPVNDPPGVFDLISPEDGFSGIDPETFQVRFEWSGARDVDEDSLLYSLSLRVVFNNIDATILRPDIADTVYEFENLRQSLAESGIFSEDTLNLEATWWVEATDGELSTESAERRILLIPVPLSVTTIDSEIPDEYSLNPVYPNPFNPVTHISFALPEPSNVRLSVFDASGRHLEVIKSGDLQAGCHSATWNGNKQPTGVYIFCLEANGVKLVTKGLLIR